MSGSGLEHRWLGRIEYADAVAEMESRRERIIGGETGAAVVLLCEHPPVITMGRRTPRDHLLVPDSVLRERGVQLCRTSRGGQATYHGPGQLVIYPVVRLQSGLIQYLQAVAGAIAETAARFGVTGASWQRHPAGVWLGGAKLAACGVHIRRMVTIHGFALNVSTPASAWELLNPCGLGVGAMTSLAAHIEGDIPAVERVAEIAGPLLTERIAAVT